MASGECVSVGFGSAEQDVTEPADRTLIGVHLYTNKINFLVKGSIY